MKFSSMMSACSTPDRIKAIDRKSVHNICSGQVIVTLSTAVKELVENAIDAGAQTVRVTFREHGLTAIEVSDDGRGISEENIKEVTLKHYTSKIRDFDDITQVSTYGFRGEALSSLCALGNLSIVTSVEGGIGTAIQYGYEGQILSTKSQARPTGTTVIVENLFHTLPVRHKEVSKNIKKEFHKAIDGLQAYSLIAHNIRIHCVNIVKKRKQVIFSTNGKSSLRENILDILGSSIFKNLVPIELTNAMFNVHGYISKPLPKHGRGSADKQYIFINGRPCDHDKLNKIINVAYRQYEKFQYPVCVLVIDLDKSFVDCNVTPNKRKLFLDNEESLLETISQYLDTEFQKYAGTYQTTNTQITLPSYSSSVQNVENKPNGNDLEIEVIKPCKTVSDDMENDFSYHMEVVEPTRASLPSSPSKIKYVSDIFLNNKDDCIISNKEEEVKWHVPKVDEVCFRPRNEVPFSISLQLLRDRYKKCTIIPKNQNETSFHYKHKTVSSNAEAESELTKTISKCMFKKMQVLGQFNLGFIIVRLIDNLFIIDQHASDEKYRFEKLQKETKLENQKLISPKVISLNGAQEDVLINFEHVFNKNGFEFNINKDLGDIGRRVSLISVPRSRNWEFDESDVEELLWLLTEAPSVNAQHIRPSKVRRMFASRACRSAVMIGTALDKHQLLNIVSNMGTMEHPWNCPHGRPTMRHLIDLSRI